MGLTTLGRDMQYRAVHRKSLQNATAVLVSFIAMRRPPKELTHEITRNGQAVSYT